MMDRAAIDVRVLGAAQVEDYRRIRLAALASEPELFGSTYEIESQRPIDVFAQRLDSCSVFAAYSGGGIVAMAGFKQEEGLKDCHKGFLWGMYVAAESRRTGIAAALVNAVLEHAKSLVEQVTLTVVSTNQPAIALYQSHGFSSYGIEPRALKHSGAYADEVLMVRFL